MSRPHLQVNARPLVTFSFSLWASGGCVSYGHYLVKMPHFLMLQQSFSIIASERHFQHCNCSSVSHSFKARSEKQQACESREGKRICPPGSDWSVTGARRQNTQLVVWCCVNRYGCGVPSAQDRAPCAVRMFTIWLHKWALSRFRWNHAYFAFSPNSFVSLILSKPLTKERNFRNKFKETLKDFFFPWRLLGPPSPWSLHRDVLIGGPGSWKYTTHQGCLVYFCVEARAA